MSFEPLDPKSIELGIPEIDAEHKEQLERMNRLGAAIHGGGTPESIADDLESLIDYLDAHFMSEQIVMREHAYPDYQKHLREHDSAVTLLRSLEDRVRAGDVHASAEVLAALRGWLISHIHTADRALAGFMGERGVAMP